MLELIRALFYAGFPNLFFYFSQGMLELIRAQFYAEFPKEDWMVPATNSQKSSLGCDFI
jgi:hypothetical protein